VLRRLPNHTTRLMAVLAVLAHLQDAQKLVDAIEQELHSG
jgi:hypothetical protein